MNITSNFFYDNCYSMAQDVKLKIVIFPQAKRKRTEIDETEETRTSEPGTDWLNNSARKK